MMAATVMEAAASIATPMRQRRLERDRESQRRRSHLMLRDDDKGFDDANADSSNSDTGENCEER